ncbi:MAG: NAD(P)H-dependent oxidoreductase [Rhodoferax sp.]|uniref:NADPH-dependent FMN reductase n=1 Tax=Rhodoferax sp. TaxID=50421 RepID=UPI0013FF555F|nr:NAD(P)H-dependent oxidoreductase [Rhodoferax sp.]NDP40439.1 NAD(P)H-dependent oxidoreductase [Rhodoferax sp.]
MKKSLKFLGIPGSLRRDSYNRAALVAAQSLLPPDVTLDIFDLEGIPMFNQDHETTPVPRLIEFKKKIREADAIVFCTPEYNYSVPGVLKNAIDCASRPFGDSAWSGKPVAVMGASVSVFGSARAQYHLRQMLVALNMFQLNQPEIMIAQAGDAGKVFDAQGKLINESSQKLIRLLLESLATWTRQLSMAASQRTTES